MDDAAVKEVRSILRQVQAHLSQARLHDGAETEQVGLVDVLHHPDVTLPYLNTVTPRKNTAWLSIKDVEKGLEALRVHGRTARVEYIEGLFPVLFAEHLRNLGLHLEYALPLMIYTADDNPQPAPNMPDGIHVSAVTDQSGSALWWYTWRNALYEVVTQVVDPVFVGQSIARIAAGSQIDLVMYRYRLPVGVARLRLDHDGKTAHISAMTIMKEVRSTSTLLSLQAACMRQALQAGCTLIFTYADTEINRRLCAENNFTEFGRVVCYAEKRDHMPLKESANDTVAQSVSTLT